MFLVGVDFDAPLALPGRKAQSAFPDPVAGWRGFDGWKMWVDQAAERIYIQSPPSDTALNATAKAEIEANGIDPNAVTQIVSYPLDRCTLRYAGMPGEIVNEAPSPALAKPTLPPKVAPAAIPAQDASPGQTAALQPAPAPAAPAKKKPSPAPQANAPQPLRREPPGAKPLVVPPVSTEIEMDGEAPKQKRNVGSLVVEAE